MSLRFGVQLFPYHKPTINPTAQFEDDLRLIEHLDRLGYDEVFVGEHHSTGWQNIPAPEILIAAAYHRTTNITFGTGVSSLPYHHPFTLADRIVYLTHLLKGRFIWGIGAGSLAQDANMLGIEPLEQRRMTEESLEAILALLEYNGPVTRKTDWFEMNDAELHYRPYGGSIDIRAAAQLSPSGPRLAGKYGIGIFQFGVMGAENQNPIAETWKVAEETAAAHGKTVSRDRWSALHLMHIAETEEEARRQVRWGLEGWVRYMNNILPLAKSDPSDIDALIDEMNETIFVIGTPEMAIKRIQTIVDQSGGIGSIVIGNTEIGNPQDTRNSFELIAREVFPAFQGSVEPRTKAVDSLTKFAVSGEKLLAAHEKARQEYAAEKAARG